MVHNTSNVHNWMQRLSLYWLLLKFCMSPKMLKLAFHWYCIIRCLTCRWSCCISQLSIFNLFIQILKCTKKDVKMCVWNYWLVRESHPVRKTSCTDPTNINRTIQNKLYRAVEFSKVRQRQMIGSPEPGGSRWGINCKHDRFIDQGQKFKRQWRGLITSRIY